MSRSIWLYGLGLVAALALLAAPQSAQAQHYHRGGYGRDCAPVPQYNYSYGYSNYGRGYDYGGYNGNYNNYYNSGYGGYYNPRPVIVHPETLHWTPGRGIHTHGHMHVPHGNHYHTRPY